MWKNSPKQNEKTRSGQQKTNQNKNRNSSSINRDQSNNQYNSLNRNFNNYNSIGSIYGCAGDDRCLPAIKNQWFYQQPNGNKICFTNYPSLDLALEKCQQFNSYWAGSCTHIASYRMYTNEYRWELLNADSPTKCMRNIDPASIQIDDFHSVSSRNGNGQYQNNQNRRSTQPKTRYRKRLLLHN